MTVKAIIFDNEWVIVRNDWDKVAKLISDGLDVPLVSGVETKKLFKLHDFFKDNLLYEYAKGQIGDVSFWSNVLMKSYYKQPTQKNIDLMKNALSQLTTEVYEPVIDLVKKLKQNFKVFILSNSTPEIYKGNSERHSYFDLFDKTYFSFKIGKKKPQPDAFFHVLKENDLNPDETIFIDDKPENIDAAKEIGMNTILFKIDDNDVDYLMSELNKFGVNIS